MHIKTRRVLSSSCIWYCQEVSRFQTRHETQIPRRIAFTRFNAGFSRVYPTLFDVLLADSSLHYVLVVETWISANSGWCRCSVCVKNNTRCTTKSVTFGVLKPAACILTAPSRRQRNGGRTVQSPARMLQDDQWTRIMSGVHAELLYKWAWNYVHSIVSRFMRAIPGVVLGCAEATERKEADTGLRHSAWRQHRISRAVLRHGTCVWSRHKERRKADYPRRQVQRIDPTPACEVGWSGEGQIEVIGQVPALFGTAAGRGCLRKLWQYCSIGREETKSVCITSSFAGLYIAHHVFFVTCSSACIQLYTSDKMMITEHSISENKYDFVFKYKYDSMHVTKTLCHYTACHCTHM